jgi:23S rRNA (uracil1939-C5)-methyltransferase
MMEYKHQLYHKRRFVEQALHHIGKLSISVPEVVASPTIWHYRNKAEYTFGTSKAGILTAGFHPRGEFAQVLDLTACQIVPPLFEEIRRALIQEARKQHLPAYHPVRHTGLLRQLIVRGGNDRTIALLSLAEDRADLAQELLLPLREAFPALQGIGYYFNPKRNDSLHDLTPHSIAGELTITYSLAQRIYQVGPKDFFQVNLSQAENLIHWIRQRLPESIPALYDLYGGVGLFGVALADRTQRVTLVEKLPEAVESARSNFLRNHSHYPDTLWEAHTGPLESLWENSVRPPKGSIAIIDPPREGLHPKVCKALSEAPFDQLFYVSCHPATQARDLALLQKGYRVIEVQPFDFFPHTTGVENVAWLERKS